MKGVVLASVVVIAVLVFAGIFFFSGNQEDNLDSQGEENLGGVGDNSVGNEETMEDEGVDLKDTPENVIEVTSDGFNPRVLEIEKGEEVTFINVHSRKSWPASSVHPTHRVYPGSDINKCGTSEQETIFDACGGLDRGEEYKFTFNEAGEWRYHDHLNSAYTGKIIVN